MDRLEQILRAEERARKAVASARERARSIANEAKAESELAVTSSRKKAEAEATRLRDGVLRESDDESRRIAERAAVEMGDEIESAEGRLDDAVRAVVRELVQ